MTLSLSLLWLSLLLGQQLKDGHPCAVSGIDYVKAITTAKSHLEANAIAMTRFAQAFKDFARQGKHRKDTACRDPIPQKPDLANDAAFTAFTYKIFANNAPAFDPVCLSALDGFIESYNSGDGLNTANLKAVRAFFKEFARGSSIPADSSSAATLAYAMQTQNKPSPPMLLPCLPT